MHAISLSRFCALAALSALASFGQTGAGTPATPQRTIQENRVTRASPGDRGNAQQARPDPASGRTIDSLLDSTEDLNSIRDGYLRRLAGDGCPPDVAIRVADLRARLHENAPRTAHGAAQGNGAAAGENNAEMERSLLILAAQWNESRPEPPQSQASVTANRETERARLLDFVLSPKDPQAGAAPSGADGAQLKAELDRLLAGCRAPGR